jgi:hypothetical protein
MKITDAAQSWKQYYLDNSFFLRVMNFLGMISWRYTKDHADAILRLLHPLSAPYILVILFIVLVLEGVIGLRENLDDMWDNGVTWW